jgi:hypothetical protein
MLQDTHLLGGKGGGKGSGQSTYSASVIVGLGEGVVTPAVASVIFTTYGIQSSGAAPVRILPRTAGVPPRDCRPVHSSG